MSGVGRLATGAVVAAVALIAWGPPVPRLAVTLAGWPVCALLISHYERCGPGTNDAPEQEKPA